MIIKTLAELQAADERTLRFTPMGPGLEREDASGGLRGVSAGGGRSARPGSPGGRGTRQSFDHLRTVFAYGVLCYEVFTLVKDHALLVIEQALRAGSWTSTRAP